MDLNINNTQKFHHKILLLCCLLFYTASGCNSYHKTPKDNKAMTKQSLIKPASTPGLPTVVYKTKKNYDDLVPVGLSNDKKQIVSYPDPRDLKNLPKPTKLADGYLLDNRGIGRNVAFLKITYEEYAQLSEVPPIDSLKKWIIDKNPLEELYDCGQRFHFKNPIKEINTLIKTGKLKEECKIMN